MESFLELSQGQLPDKEAGERLPLRLYVGLFYLLIGICFYIYFK